MKFFVYIIKCTDGTLYTGYTKNLKKRMKQHFEGKGARYTRLHPPEKIVYLEEYASRKRAMSRERQIKGLSHEKKLGLSKKRRKSGNLKR